MKFDLVFRLLATFLLSLPVCAAQRPNVVLMLADDFGYECVGANGGTSYRTPNLDQLAAKGVRFERCYAQPLCTPTRVQLMTGHYNIRNYIDFGGMQPGLRTFGNIFKDAGYATAIVGKWQLGRDRELPRKFGFEESYLWQHMRRPSRYANPGLELNGVNKDWTNGEYGPDLLNEFAMDFITRKKDVPFFLYYPLTLTHGPYSATPDSEDWRPNRRRERKSRNPEHFAEMVAYADKLVGNLLAHLDALGLRENTLIIFLGDNGTGAGTQSRMGDRMVIGAKGKGSEAGMRVPLIASWPSAHAGGRTLADLVDTTDFLPTIAEAASISLPADYKPDGCSFLPQIRGEKGNPREWIYSWYAPRGELKHEFAADGRWKLHRTGAFFDTVADPHEKRPLAVTTLTGEAAGAAARLQRALHQFKDARPANLPTAPPGKSDSDADDD